MQSRFSNAIGIWEVKVEEAKLELKPKLKDVKLFRNIIVSEKNVKTRSLLFDKFSDFMFGMIQEQYPESDDPDLNLDQYKLELRTWVEVNISHLFSEAMIAFHWTTREEMDKTKTESIEDLKKKMSSV